ncbi:MAG: hypothetical protein IJR49_04475 [Treponema sp.]|nr:hypothetical protein [Treponema sp.]
MKKIVLLLCVFFVCTGVVFCQEDSSGDEYDDGFVYTQNGRGDQYIQISLMPSFPLNFKKHMYVGGAAQLGYRRFLTSWFALGGDITVGYHPTIGSNVFNFWPITFCAMFQPSIWRFEFPITLAVGMAFETYASLKYFPGFVVKPEVAAFFRITDSWSVGLGCDFLWLPQWNASKLNKDLEENGGTFTEAQVKDKAFHGLFIMASISVRYHF